MDNYASFISEALEKTKCRECVPSWEEIQMLMNRQEMLCTVHYPGPGSCQLYISSHTTASEVCLPSSEVLAKHPSFSQRDFSITASLLKRAWLLSLVSNCERMCLFSIVMCPVGSPPTPLTAAALQVVRRIQEKLGLQESRNTFALYEQNALWEQPVAGGALIADILTRLVK